MATEEATASKVIRATTLVLSYDREEREVYIDERENIPYAGLLNRQSSPEEQMAWIVREIAEMDLPLSGLKDNQHVRFVITIEEDAEGDDDKRRPHRNVTRADMSTVAWASVQNAEWSATDGEERRTHADA